MTVEVVMRKEMELNEYHEMRLQAISKGWSVSSYTLNFFTKDETNKI